jgi:steroid delta-isomerase-like uncharacterized protein
MPDHTPLLTRYYDAFNLGDTAGLLACLSDDVVHDINQSERVVGRDAFGRFMERMNRCYRERITDLVLFTGRDGNRAAAEYTVNGMYLHDDAGLPPARGQTYILAGGAFFAFTGGKISRVTNYYNLQQWLQQVQ